MTTAILAFLLMLVVVGGMAVGVMFGREPISGSCGGMKRLGINGECEICGGNPTRCETISRVDPDLANQLAQDVSGGPINKIGKREF